jgi:ATP-binding cassette subfamily B protein
LVLAAIAQLLGLIDPIIFGKIIDDYATNPGKRPQKELINGVLMWLGYCYWYCCSGKIDKSFPGIYYKTGCPTIRDADIQ